MKRGDCRLFRGSVIDNNGYWCLLARLPSENRRRKHLLRAPGAKSAMRTDRPRELAEAETDFSRACPQRLLLTPSGTRRGGFLSHRGGIYEPAEGEL